ncbi:GNAT family N-acetyltransferase [Streptomyces sp. YGL11-2]|uniref:GNAT family N-acetyltransferase n=1 Tax=Streptomyces sp. YGL11-2 TaxID=3414028 RepID=UPI003CEC12AC
MVRGVVRGSSAAGWCGRQSGVRGGSAAVHVPDAVCGETSWVAVSCTRDDAPVPELLTARLRLRPWRDNDLDPLAEMYADPEVMRYSSGRPPCGRRAGPVPKR